MPFGDYDDFDDCVSKNRDKEDPEAYCASIKRKVEGKDGDCPICEKVRQKVWDAVEGGMVISQEETTATFTNPTGLKQVLKADITIAAEMIQRYHVDTELPWLRPFLPEDIRFVKVFKPYAELEKMQASVTDWIPYVMPHSSGTFLKDQCPNSMRKEMKDFIKDEEVFGKVKGLTADSKHKKIKGTVYITKNRVEDKYPGTIKRIEDGEVIDVSIGFICEFTKGGIYKHKDGRSEEYLLTQRNMLLGHVAGLVHQRGKCPSGICGINQDHAHSDSEADTSERKLIQSSIVVIDSSIVKGNVEIPLSEELDLKLNLEGPQTSTMGGLNSENLNISDNGSASIMTPEEIAKLQKQLLEAQAQIDQQAKELQKFKDSQSQAMQDESKRKDAKIEVLEGQVKKLTADLKDANEQNKRYVADEAKALEAYFEKHGIEQIFGKALGDASLEEKRIYKQVRDETLDNAIKQGQGFTMPSEDEHKGKQSATQSFNDMDQFSSMEIGDTSDLKKEGA